MSSRECYMAMYQRNFKSNHGARRLRRGSKYLEKGKTERESETPVLGGVESTQELQDSMEERRNRYQKVLEPLRELFLRVGKNDE
jgi:hypothetical protein